MPEATDEMVEADGGPERAVGCADRDANGRSEDWRAVCSNWSDLALWLSSRTNLAFVRKACDVLATNWVLGAMLIVAGISVAWAIADSLSTVVQLAAVTESAAVVVALIVAYREFLHHRHTATAETFLRLEEQMAEQRELRRRIHATADEHQHTRLRQWRLYSNHEPVGEAADVAVRLNVIGKLSEAGRLAEDTVLDMFAAVVADMWARMAASIRLEREHREPPDPHYLEHFECLACRAAEYRRRRGFELMAGEEAWLPRAQCRRRCDDRGCGDLRQRWQDLGLPRPRP